MARHPVSPGDLLKVTVTTPVEAEEAVAALMERLFRQPVAMYTDEETLRTEVSVFLASPRLWSAAGRARLEAGLRRLRAAGVPLGRARLQSAVLPHRDWAEAWKRHFKPLEFGGRLLVLPTWSRRQAAAGQAVVRLDPGLSFGTGQHPTTAFCLEQIVAGRPGPEPRSLLDIGCGSGILAIAAAKLGYQPVEAFDLDLEAIRVAGENAVLNGVADRIALGRRDLTRLPVKPARRFDVVCANLLADLLTAQAPRLTNRVTRGGTLVVAGVLAEEFEKVCGVYADRGWRLVAEQQGKEWRSGAFRLRSHRSDRSDRSDR
jgi:ribosomal protein L11 methyltransferase